MANVNIKGNEGGQLAQGNHWGMLEPFRRMRELMGWDPFSEMTPIPFSQSLAQFSPAFDVKETKDSYVFKADLPGVKEQDIDLTVIGDRLTITGKRETEQEDKSDTYYTYERSYGSFTRSFTIPEGVNAEQARAELKEGVLTVVLPKKPEVQPKKIQLKSGEKAKA